MQSVANKPVNKYYPYRMFDKVVTLDWMLQSGVLENSATCLKHVSAIKIGMSIYL